MTEPDQIEFHERVAVSDSEPDGRSPSPSGPASSPGSAALVVIGAVAGDGRIAIGDSVDRRRGEPAHRSRSAAGTLETRRARFATGFRGGFGRGGFHAITIAAINGSNLSLETEDGWTRTITVGSDDHDHQGRRDDHVGDLAVGDQIGFAQEREDDGTFTITAIKVVLPTIGGEVTAVTGQHHHRDRQGRHDRHDPRGRRHRPTRSTAPPAQALSDIEVGDLRHRRGHPARRRLARCRRGPQRTPSRFRGGLRPRPRARRTRTPTRTPPTPTPRRRTSCTTRVLTPTADVRRRQSTRRGCFRPAAASRFLHSQPLFRVRRLRWGQVANPATTRSETPMFADDPDTDPHPDQLTAAAPRCSAGAPTARIAGAVARIAATRRASLPAVRSAPVGARRLVPVGRPGRRWNRRARCRPARPGSRACRRPAQAR